MVEPALNVKVFVPLVDKPDNGEPPVKFKVPPVIMSVYVADAFAPLAV